MVNKTLILNKTTPPGPQATPEASNQSIKNKAISSKIAPYSTTKLQI